MFFGFLLSSSLFAEVQQSMDVHQYIVRQAWELAKYQCPYLINTDLADHIGTIEIGDDEEPWSNGLVVTGAYREDKEDPVYLYGGVDPELINLLHVSMSHFWNADGGDDFKWNWEGADWHNHYQKAKVYLYGGHSIFFYHRSAPILGWFYSYNNLFEFYSTGSCYYNGYIDIYGNVEEWDSDELITIDLTQAQNRAYCILGRLCHLIGDAGTPAHVHNDAHIPADSYETYMESHYSDYNWQDALEAGGFFSNIFSFNYPLRFLMYTTNQIADHFPSEDIYGWHLETGDNTVTYTYEDDYYEELYDIIENLGSVPTSVNEADIAENAFVYSIRSTATMLYWFARMTNQIEITTSGILPYNEIWDRPVTLTGNVYVPSGVTLLIQSNASINLGSYSIVSTGGTITVISGATINSSNSHVRLKTGSVINGLYPTIESAVASALSGQTIEIYGSHTLTASYSVPSGISLSIKSGASITFGSYSIVSTGGTITVASGVINNPDARRKSGSTLIGLYPSIPSALAAASVGQSVDAYGSHTLSSNLTVSSGKTLTVKSGATLSFASGYSLYVYGTLNASGTSSSRVTFTRSGSSGTWGGIRYYSGSSGTMSYGSISYGTYGVYLNSSSPDVDHCNISSCSNGIYCTGASPNISNNNLTGSGFSVYNGSPNLVSNQVSGASVYMNACNSYMYNNYFSNGPGSYAYYLYASSPDLFNNSISTSTALITIYATNGSDPWFGDVYPDNGYNYLSNSNDADGVLWAYNGSNPLLGYGGGGLYYGGYNSIIGGEGVYPVAALDGTSSVDAHWCWWGQYPAPYCYGDVTTYYALQSDPGGGSSLAKSSYLAYSDNENESDLSAADSLYKIGMSLFFEKQYEEAVAIFKSIIVDYPGTVYASKALSMVMWAGRKYEKLDRLALLDELLDQTGNKDLAAALKGRKVLLYRQAGEIGKAVDLSREILSENPDSLRECNALFDLFNLYQKDLGDSAKAGEYLSVLKNKYPDDNQTLIARNDCGEDMAGAISKKYTFSAPEPEPETVTITPTVFNLRQAHPNPFNMLTTITFDLPEEAKVEIVVYDLMGHEIWKSAKTNYTDGTHSVIWNGTNYSGQPVGTGMYLIRMNTNKYTATQKVLLMK